MAKTLYRVIDVHGVQMYEDGVKAPTVDDGPTPDSIASAREAQRRERAEVFEQTGILILDYEDTLFRHRCTRPGCDFVAEHHIEWRCIHLLANHLVNVHLPESVRRGYYH